MNVGLSLSGSELFHHHGLLADVLDLLDHIELLLDVALIVLEDDHVLVDGGVSQLVSSAGQSCDLSELGPVPAFVDLRTAGVDAFDHLDLLGLDDVVLVVALDHLLEGLAHLSAHHRHFTKLYYQIINSIIAHPCPFPIDLPLGAVLQQFSHMRQVGRGGNPLTGSYTFETNCTLDEPSQRAIQVNVIQPKKKAFMGESYEDHLFLSQDNTKVLSEGVKRHKPSPITVHFSHKREAPREHTMESSFGLQANTQIPLQHKMGVQKMQQNPSNPSNNIEPPASNTNFKDKQKPAIQRDHLIEIAEQLASNSLRKGSKNDSVVIDLSPNESMRNLNESLLIDIDEKPILEHLSHQPPTAKFIVPPLAIVSATQNRHSRVSSIQSQRGDRSNSKMKLRDYLYMVEATSKQSSLQKRTQTSLSKQTPQTKNIEKSDKGRHEGGAATERSTLSTKREQGMMKYSVSNGKMLDILKKEIHEDICQVGVSLKKIDQEIIDFKIGGEVQPTNEELLILYSVRRQVKQEISKRLDMAMQMIKDHKKALALPGSSHSHKQSVYERTRH